MVRTATRIGKSHQLVRPAGRKYTLDSLQEAEKYGVDSLNPGGDCVLGLDQTDV